MVLIFSHHHTQYSSLRARLGRVPIHFFLSQPPVATTSPPPSPGALILTARLQPSDGSPPGLTIPLDVPTTIPTARARPCGGVQSRLQLRHGHHHLPINALLLATKLQMLGWTVDVYEGGPASQPASPTSPAQPNPTQFVIMENQNPMSMTGHPRNRRAYEKRWERRKWRAKKKREKQKETKTAPLPNPSLSTFLLRPSSLSSQAHNRPWLPLAYLDSACFRRPCLRLFKRRPQPLALSACKQRSPDFCPPSPHPASLRQPDVVPLERVGR